MRLRARDCLDRAKMHLADSNELRYACLELRFCIEYLAIDRLQAYLVEVPNDALKKWTPRAIISEILDVDPNGDRSISLAIGIGSTSGASQAAAPIQLGEDRRFTMKWANKNYNTLSNFLHAPTLFQIELGADPKIEVMRTRVSEIIAELAAVLASPIQNVNFGNFFETICSCGTAIKRRAGSIPKFGLTCPNKSCEASYEVNEIEGGFTYVIKTMPITCQCSHAMWLPLHQLKVGGEFRCMQCKTLHQIVLGIQALSEPDASKHVTI